MAKDVNELLNSYGFVFSKPQFNHFSHYIKSLIVCEKSTIQRFSYLHNKDRSNLNRFLTESPWEIEDIKSIYHQQLKCSFRPRSSLLIDDTISHRPYARKVEKVNWHYDHTKGGKSLGYSLVTAVIKDDKGVLPYDILPYYRKENTSNFFSKNELAARIISSTIGISQIDTVLFDSWYCNKTVISACKNAGKNYISMLKSNHNVTINMKKNAVRSFVRHIKKEDRKEIKINERKFRLFSTNAFVKKIGSAHLIFSQLYNEKKGCWGDTYYVISSKLTTPSEDIITQYLQRVGIEVFHREAKQNVGLEGYFLRKNRGIERYLFLSLLAYGFLALQERADQKSKSIGEMTQKYKAEVFAHAFDQIQQAPHMKNIICERLATARV